MDITAAAAARRHILRQFLRLQRPASSAIREAAGISSASSGRDQNGSGRDQQQRPGTRRRISAEKREGGA